MCGPAIPSFNLEHESLNIEKERHRGMLLCILLCLFMCCKKADFHERGLPFSIYIKQFKEEERMYLFMMKSEKMVIQGDPESG